MSFGVQAWDLCANTLLTHLPAKGVSYAVRLNDAGESSMSLSLTDPQVSQLTRVIQGLDGLPFKVIITANDSTTILHSAIMWAPSMTSSSYLMPIRGKALTSYFNHVTSATNYTTPISPTDLMAAVVTDVQARVGANIWLGTRKQVSNPPPAFTPAYTANQYTTAAQIMADLTAAATPGTGGVDYYVEDAFVNGVPRHTLVICAPRAGRDRNTSTAAVNLDSAEWTWPTDGEAAGNQIVVVGAGSGGAQPAARGYSLKKIGGAAQSPLLEQVYQYSQVSSQPQLQAIANGQVQIYGDPVTVPTVTLPADYKPLPLGSFTIGDDVYVTASKSVWFPKGKAEWWRIAAYSVDIKDSETATYTLTLNKPPVF